MPIFAYRCPDCGHAFDALQKVGADPLSECPNCCGQGLRKLVSAPNFHLKGKGWRKTADAEKAQQAKKKPRFAHTFDSPVPHADHHDHSHDHSHGSGTDRKHDHDHKH